MTTNAPDVSNETQTVRQARAKLGNDLDAFSDELERQIGHTVEKLAWKAGTAAAAIVSGLLVRKVIEFIWKKAGRGDAPDNPASPNTSWTDAIIWTFATAAGMAVARVVAERGAAAGWEKATGHLPPGLDED